MSNNKELPTPRELGLEDDKGNIRKVEEAEERAYAEQLFMTVLANKDMTLDEETVKVLQAQAEQAGEMAGQQWREEHIEELLRDYEERIKKIQAEQRIPDPEVARAMAEAEIPYLASASLKGISNADKGKLLESGEQAAEKAFLISAPKRLEVLNTEIKLLKEQFKKIEQNYTEKVSILSNPRWNVHTGAAWVESLYPEHFAIEMKEQSGIKSVSDREIGKEFNLTQANQINALKWIYDSEHIQENIKIIEEIKMDCEKLLPKIDNFRQEAEKMLKQQIEKAEELKKEPILTKKEPLFGKDKYRMKKNEIFTKLNQVENQQWFNSDIITAYEGMIKKAQNIIETTPKIEELLSQLTKLSNQMEKKNQICSALQSRIDKIKQNK